MTNSRTKFVLFTICFALILTLSTSAHDPPYGNVKLLDGYRYKRSRTFDTINGLIYKVDGLSIKFESGTGEGYAADPKESKTYLWFRQQQINGHKVFVALTDFGVGTRWEPDKRRGPNPGRILMVTFPGKMSPLDAANFHAEVLDEKEIADMLLMVLTFDPTK